MRGRARLLQKEAPVDLRRAHPTGYASQRIESELVLPQNPLEGPVDLPPNWHLVMPPGAEPVHAADRTQVGAAAPAADVETVLCQIKCHPNEIVVIHSFSLLGWETRTDPDFGPALGWREMPKHTTYEKLYWDIQANGTSLMQVARGGDGTANPSKGFRTLEEYSYQKGNTMPIIVRPGNTVRLLIVGLNPAAGLPYSALGAYLEGRMSGYRVRTGR